MAKVTFVVTRHAGAVEWLQYFYGFRTVRLVSHFDVSMIEPGDNVVGTLPIHLACKVCEAGAAYFNLVLDLPEEARGKELTANDMERYGARIERFIVSRYQ
jgi:CRISPR-associated protein Csx16